MTSVPTKILACQQLSMCPKKSAVLACLTMSKLKMNQHVPNKNADLLKKNQLNGNRVDDWVRFKLLLYLYDLFKFYMNTSMGMSNYPSILPQKKKKFKHFCMENLDLKWVVKICVANVLAYYYYL